MPGSRTMAGLAADARVSCRAEDLRLILVAGGARCASRMRDRPRFRIVYSTRAEVAVFPETGRHYLLPHNDEQDGSNKK